MAETHNLHAANLFDCRNYVAVVTGGATGIGLMNAQALAANGARVYITSRREGALENAAESHQPIHAHSGKIIPLGPCDVTKKEDLEWLVKEMEKREGYINVFVANAGVNGPSGSPDERGAEETKKNLWQEDFEGWSSVFNTNVSGVYFSSWVPQVANSY
jgi:NAD(P)-dependent dehydrogenase (short-subunit alcohol dehydrogenase family)